MEQEKDKENGVPATKGEDESKKGEDKKGGIEVKVFDPETVGRMPTNQLVGVVWEYARNLGEISISNHIAIAQEMKGIAQLLQDAHEEVQELAQNADSGGINMSLPLFFYLIYLLRINFEEEELSSEEGIRLVTQFVKRT